MSALTCVVLTLLSASCGSEGDATLAPEATSAAQGSNIITSVEIEHLPQGSPQRALLAWFQAIQFRDLAGVRARTTSREIARVSPKTLDEAVEVVGATLGKPRIESVRESKNRAAVRVFIQSFAPGKPEPVLEIPHTFYLERVSKAWRVDDVSYLVDTAQDFPQEQSPQ